MLVPLLPPPPQLDEDTKVTGPPLEYNRRTVPDADLDISIDLGEAVARTPGLTSLPKPRSASPVLPDYLSPVNNAPVIGTQRPGECKALGALLLTNSYAYVQTPLPPAPLSIMPRRL